MTDELIEEPERLPLAEEATLIEEPPVSQERVDYSTLLIEVASKDYPVTLNQIRAKYPASWPDHPLRYDIETLGYAVVTPTPQPEGDVVTETAPVLGEDGVWIQTWASRAWNAEETAQALIRAKEQANTVVMVLRDQNFLKGMPYTLNGETWHVQLREQDKINLVVLNLQAQGVIAKDGSPTFEFRNYENKSVQLTTEEMLDVTNRALLAVNGIFKTSWTLKDQIDAAERVEDLPSIPENFIPEM